MYQNFGSVRAKFKSIPLISVLKLALIRKILIPVDGSDASVKAATFAAALAKNAEAEAVFLYVLESEKAAKELEVKAIPGAALPEGEEKIFLASELKRTMRKYNAIIERSNVKHSSQVVVGNPADKILEAAKKVGADMIVMGFVGLKGVRKVAAFGSVARAVTERSKIPVTVVPT